MNGNRQQFSKPAQQMPHALAISELPPSLHEMIADARNTIEQWERNEQGLPKFDDELWHTVYDSLLHLSRGEYKTHTYWECVAEDAELAGDWSRAKFAYRKILSTQEAHLWWGRSHRGLATLSSLLGAPKKALKHLHAAAQHERGAAGNILYRVSIAREAWCLLKLGRVRSAESALRRGMSTFKPGHSDYINYATLHIVSAACQVTRHSLASAEDLLKIAHGALDILVPQDDKAQAGSGSLSACAWWWKVEADRCRDAHLLDQELAALTQRLDFARLSTNGWTRLDLDAGVMQAWDAVADAYDRHGRGVEAAEARTEARRIREQWHLPPNAGPPVTANSSNLYRACQALLKSFRK